MKLLPWVLLAAALAGFFWTSDKSKDLESEVKELRVQVNEVSQLRAEVEELKKVPVTPAADLERLQRETQEIHKLRNEVRQLREEKQQLSQRVQQTEVIQVNSENQPKLTLVEQLQKENEQLRHENEEFQRARVQAQGNACVNNLRQLDGATEQWALEYKMSVGAVPGWNDLVGEDRYIRRQPVCPLGGQYSLAPVGNPPTCSVPGHQLPQ